MKTVPYAHFHQRVLAQILDAFLLFALFSPLLYLINNLLFPYLGNPVVLAAYKLIRFLLIAGLTVSAFALCLERFGATPGKMLLGLKVINQQTGQFLDRKQAALRVLLGWVSVLSGIGVLIAILDKHKQAAHDKILHTIVIMLEDDYACMELPDNWRPSA